MTFKIKQEPLPISFVRVGTMDIKDMFTEAAKDPELGDFIYQKKLSDTMVFMVAKEPVGFAIPRRDSDGYYRTGPIFVKAGWRRKGIAKAFVLEYFSKNPKGRAWIDEKNKASQALYRSAGFIKTNNYATEKRIGGCTLYEWLKG